MFISDINSDSPKEMNIKIKEMYEELCETIERIDGLSVSQRWIGHEIKKAVKIIIKSNAENYSIKDLIKSSLVVEIEEGLVISFFKERLLVSSLDNELIVEFINELIVEFIKDKRITFVNATDRKIKGKIPLLWRVPDDYMGIYSEIVELSECEELKKVKMKLFFKDSYENKKESMELIIEMFSEYIEEILIELNHKIDEYFDDKVFNM